MIDDSHGVVLSVLNRKALECYRIRAAALLSGERRFQHDQ
jgi:hypothetical protein